MELGKKCAWKVRFKKEYLGAFDPNEGYQRGDPIKGRSIKKYL